MLTLNFSPFPVLKTSRLVLRRPANEDENDIFFLRSDESVNQYVDRPRPKALADARKHIERVNNATDNNDSIFWCIALTDEPGIIGTICLYNISKENHTAEVGFDLSPLFQGKGIMTEAFSDVARYAFNTMKITKLIGWVRHENSKSLLLLSKFNFTRDLEEEEKADKAELENMVIYTLNSANYPGLHQTGNFITPANN